jgi:hypothetical protein
MVLESQPLTKSLTYCLLLLLKARLDSVEEKAVPLQERLKAGIPTLEALFPEAGPSMPLQELFYLTEC